MFGVYKKGVIMRAVKPYSTVKSSQLIFEIYRKESIGKELRLRRPLWIRSYLKYWRISGHVSLARPLTTGLS